MRHHAATHTSAPIGALALSSRAQLDAAPAPQEAATDANSPGPCSERGNDNHRCNSERHHPLARTSERTRAQLPASTDADDPQRVPSRPQSERDGPSIATSAPSTHTTLSKQSFSRLHATSSFMRSELRFELNALALGAQRDPIDTAASSTSALCCAPRPRSARGARMPPLETAGRQVVPSAQGNDSANTRSSDDSRPRASAASSDAPSSRLRRSSSSGSRRRTRTGCTVAG